MVFFKKPENFTSTLAVVSCFIERNGLFVLCKRQDRKPHPRKRGPPAGKVEKGESIQQAIQREIQEETGLKASESCLNFIGSSYVRQGIDFVFHEFFRQITSPKKPSISIDVMEHSTYKRVTPQQALRMPLVEDEEICIKRFYGVM